MSFDELPAAPPPDSFVEEASMVDDGESSPVATDVDAAPAPRLDLVLLAKARRSIGEAEMYTAGNLHPVAIVKARDALHTIVVALEKLERAAFIERLVEVTEPPFYAGERDTQHAEAE